LGNPNDREPSPLALWRPKSDTGVVSLRNDIHADLAGPDLDGELRVLVG
jgi:hypothetical protein